MHDNYSSKCAKEFIGGHFISNFKFSKELPCCPTALSNLGLFPKHESFQRLKRCQGHSTCCNEAPRKLCKDNAPPNCNLLLVIVSFDSTGKRCETRSAHNGVTLKLSHKNLNKSLIKEQLEPASLASANYAATATETAQFEHGPAAVLPAELNY